MSREELAAIRTRLAQAANYSAKFSVADARRLWYAYTDAFQIPANLSVRAETIAGRPIEWVHRRGVEPNAALLYLHGGGFVCGSIASHRPIVCELAQNLEGVVVSLDYRLAPEHPFPAALEDAVAAYAALLTSGFPATRLAVGGESAGAGLAVALLLALRDRGLPQPAGIWCLSPWADLTNSGQTVHSKAATDPIVFKDAIDITARLYLNGHSPEDPLVSPIYADFRELAPMLIQVGSSEILIDDAFRLARAAAMADLGVTLEIWPQMLHAWHIFSGELSEGRDAAARTAQWLNNVLRAMPAAASRPKF